MHNCSYLAQDTSEGPKAVNKPSSPYNSWRLKKICSCPTTHFHHVGGTSVIQNWKDTGLKVSFSNSVSGIFSQSRRGGVAIEQLLELVYSISGNLSSVKKGFNFLVLHFTKLSTSKGLCGQDDNSSTSTEHTSPARDHPQQRPIHDIYSLARLFWWAHFPTFHKLCKVSAFSGTALNIQLSRNLPGFSHCLIKTFLGCIPCSFGPHIYC